MKNDKRYATAVLTSFLGAAILCGVALAGNPHGTPPGHANGQVSASASLGVKPSASTNSTHNTNAAAASTQTKLYGNGKTAGQIAMQAGAGASTNLYGPGNSQPHKASLCAGSKTHLVDVHALKAHGASASCTSASTSTSTSGSASLGSQGKPVGVGAKASGGNSSKGALTPPSTTRNGGGTSSQGAVSGRAHAARPVLGTANFTG
jgi:hypothetical protein